MSATSAAKESEGGAAPRPRRRGGRRLIGDALRCERGETFVSFGLILPLLVALSLAILEFTVVTFEYHRAGEATRRGARLATILAPAGDLSGLAAGATVNCGFSDGNPACGGTTVQSGDTMSSVLASMQAIQPAIGAENVQIDYALSGVGDPATPGGILPLVTVTLANLQYDFLVLDAVPGMPDAITFPPFVTSYLAAGNDVSP